MKTGKPIQNDEKSRRSFVIRNSAFTLIEIMVAIAIFSMVVAAIFSTLLLVLRATQVGQSAAARAQRERVTMNTIENSLMCIQSFQASPKYYSFIVANGDSPVLSFASRVPEIFPRNGKFGDFKMRRLTFSLEAEKDKNEYQGQKNLVLRQNPILMDMDADEQNNPLILARNVKNFSVECWDTNQLDWVTEWDDTNSIPPMLRVELVLAGNNDKNNNSSLKEDSDLTVVRAFSLPSTMMPVVVQMGAGGGGFTPQPGQAPGQPPGLQVPPPQ